VPTLLIPACIALITLLAWAYLVHLDRQMSADMEHDKMMAAMGMTMDMPWSG
jgi:predicted metal-binding membrane protein